MNTDHTIRIFLFAALLGATGCTQETGKSVEPGKSEAYQQAVEAAARGDRAEAYALYARAADEQSDAMAHFTLGLMLRDGQAPAGAAEDTAVAACQRFELAAEAGLPFAQHLTGDCLRRGVHKPVDIDAALGWYYRAIRGGHGLSNCTIAELYMSGEGMEKDPDKALELCGSVADISPPAMVSMGLFRLEGDEGVRDYGAALQWFSQAADRNHAEAYYHLGRMSEMGMINEYPPERAHELFEKAAQGRYVPAYLPAGRLYLRRPPEEATGALSADDLAKGYMWLSAARIAGDEATRAAAESDLAPVLEVMPESWRPDLDARVEAFLKE